MGAAILYSLTIALAATSIWLGRNQSLYDFWFYITNFARYPMEIYHRGWGVPLWGFFTFVVPVLVVVNVPARLLAQPLHPRAWWEWPLAGFAVAGHRAEPARFALGVQSGPAQLPQREQLTLVFEVARSQIRQNSGRCGGRRPARDRPNSWEFGYFRSKSATSKTAVRQQVFRKCLLRREPLLQVVWHGMLQLDVLPAERSAKLVRRHVGQIDVQLLG